MIKTFALFFFNVALLTAVNTHSVQAVLKTMSNKAVTKVGNPAASPQSSGVPIPNPQKNFVPYCQGDPRWADVCHMAGAGCGPTSLAMVLSSFGIPKTPLEVDQTFQDKGWRGCGDYPSSMVTALASSWLHDLGFEVIKLSTGKPDLTEAKTYVDYGYIIIGSTRGHIFVVDRVYPSENNMRVRDPELCNKPEGDIRDADLPWRSESWAYSYAIKRI